MCVACSQIVGNIAQIYHSVKADLCRANQVDNRDAESCRANQRHVRFKINVDNNNDIQHFNDDRKCVCNGAIGVGMCKSSFEGPRDEV